MLFKSKQIVGLDIGSTSVKIVGLKPGKKNEFELVHLGLEQLAPDTIVDGAIMAKLPVAEAINRIYNLQGIKVNNVATSISGHSVIVKKVNLPAQSPEELSESIMWEAEQYIPFDISDVNVDYEILKSVPGTGTIEVLLVAVKKEKISDHTSVINLAGKVPSIVDIDAFALLTSYVYNYQPTGQTVTALLNIGASITNLCIAKGAELLFTRDISIGGNQYTDFLQKGLSISFEEAEKVKRGAAVGGVNEAEVHRIMDSVSEIIELEIQKTFDFFKATTTTDRIDRMILSGGAARTRGLSEHLSQKFEVPVEIFNAFKRITYNPQKFDSSFINDISPRVAIAVGLAMRNTEDKW
ncbi:MAG TPA: type IV pilus assembly protein PilM [Acidobacteriota bacterium]|jgi:type IV pilus assembly protein PilM|nr:type IV pilus assembly protein PilM [Acidobacteriota bacterium]HNU01694.1 type IV pilus assembly protein PilM [Acidobacteriota bacterium]HOT01112.1 type IV pilus assembly protein PilM [Acidobacteriota bacterium]HPB26647.1 type IV pilus assembly protein PilM [Acidobacteriota bacterium]HQF86969.1 type IV pilus assembly protein PilM [Acidobacteriota bacterium]